MTELCHRCHIRPGKDRYYLPYPEKPFLGVSGSTIKMSMKKTVGCDECWSEFNRLRKQEE
jgi:hypothetical protein